MKCNFCGRCSWHNTSTLEVQCHFTTWSRNCIQRPQTFFSCSGWWLKESSRSSRGIPRLPFGLWEQYCQRSLSVSQLLQECAMIIYTDLQTMKSDATFTIYCLLWCAMMLNQLRLPCATQDWIPGYWMVAIYVYYMIQRKFQLGRLVINFMVVTPLNLYYTGPVATFVWINMQNFRNFCLYPFFSSSNPFLNKFRILTCSICWSCNLNFMYLLPSLVPYD